jgi:hypothetical protein
MLTADQTRRLLHHAVDNHSGHPVTAALLILALDDRILFGPVRWLDIADLVITQIRPRRVAVRLPPELLIPLPPVVADQLAAHAEAYPNVRRVIAVDGRERVPLLRSRTGGRLTLAGVMHGMRGFCRDADDDIRVHAAAISTSWIEVVDLADW